VAHRGDLHAALLEATDAEAVIAIHSGFELASFSETDAEVRATSRGDVTVAAPALVGADGLWSTVRGVLHPLLAPQFTGATATRTVIPADEAWRRWRSGANGRSIAWRRCRAGRRAA
jgi:salicylate hydroxylase